MSKNTVTRAPNGSARREVPLDSIQVPDLWHVAERLQETGDTRGAELVREAWHLAHDLLRELRERSQ